MTDSRAKEKYLIVFREKVFPYRCTDVRVYFDGIEDLCSYLLQNQEKFTLISLMWCMPYDKEQH